jgi:hypothetical protein
MRAAGISLPPPAPMRADLFEVLKRRTSRPGTLSLSDNDLASILWHSTLIRERRSPQVDHRGWESRAAPAAGGLHGIEILCLPLEPSSAPSWYDPLHHRLIPASLNNELREMHRRLIGELCRCEAGVTLQFVSDWRRLSLLYRNAESLLWRDAGALLATICLVAEAYEVACTPFGRESVVSGLTPSDDLVRWRSCGGVHLSRLHS